MPVPVRPGGVRPSDRGLGGGQPAAQRISEIVGVRVGRGLDPVSQHPADVEQHQSQGNTGRHQHEPAIVHHQRQQLYSDDEANTQGYKPFHTELAGSRWRREFVEDQLKHAHRDLTMALVHHMRAESRLLEQVHQLHGVIGMQRMVFDGSGQHLGRGVEVLRGGSGDIREFTFHRRVAGDDRLPWFAAEVGHLGQPDFGRPHKQFRTLRRCR